jgi:hypothetical protein
VAWTWTGSSEAPTFAVLGGGTLVLVALAGNEVVALRAGRYSDAAALENQSSGPPHSIRCNG